MSTPEERIRQVVAEEVAIAAYNPEWSRLFREEKEQMARLSTPGS